MLNSIVGLLGNGAAAGGGTSYESIATVSLSGTQSTITFSSIPSTYTHLQLRFFARNSRAANQDIYYIRFNSDTGTNYSDHEIYGDGATSFAGNTTTTSAIILTNSAAGNTAANVFGSFVVDIFDYKNTNKYKTTRSLGGFDANGTGYTGFSGGNWRDTSAISTITIVPNVGSFVQYSHFALYGIKGA